MELRADGLVVAKAAPLTFHMTDSTSKNTPPSSWEKDWQAQWAKRQQQQRLRASERHLRDRTYFGSNLWRTASAEQKQATTDVEQLQSFNLPLLDSEQAVADFLGITLGELRWFTYDKAQDVVWHYRQYTIKKRNGGERIILAPKDRLKKIQRHLLDDLLYRIPVSDQAHGFVPTRSTTTNALPHVHKEFIVNIDLEEFFPSITFPRVRGLFLSLGFSFSVASALALLCTDYEREKIARDGKTEYQKKGERYLVQGAPTSPAIANLIARHLDVRLRGLAEQRKFVYTRYADDLTFSGSSIEGAVAIIAAVRRIAREEGFTVHKDKTRLLRRANRQTVTGVIVNDILSTPRSLRRRLRAIVHNAQKTGLAVQNKNGHSNFREYIAGIIGYIAAANPQQAKPLLTLFKQLPPDPNPKLKH